MKTTLVLLLVLLFALAACGKDGSVSQPPREVGVAPQPAAPAPPLQPVAPATEPAKPIPPPHSCGDDADCICSCKFGAVNRDWYSHSVDPATECKDGCASKGMVARCEQGRCAAYFRGETEAHTGCTGKDVTELLR
jgi:predicted small lipoprotein YifL